LKKGTRFIWREPLVGINIGIDTPRIFQLEANITLEEVKEDTDILRK